MKRRQAAVLRKAKVAVGAAFRRAFGDQARRKYGHEGLISALCSGEKVPDYLASVYLDEDARRRFALALLKGDPKVRVRTVVDIDE